MVCSASTGGSGGRGRGGKVSTDLVETMVEVIVVSRRWTGLVGLLGELDEPIGSPGYGFFYLLNFIFRSKY
jgi:hypothetical protein